MEITREFIECVLSSFFRRCEAAKLAGGVPLYKVVDRQAEIPDGWVLDPMTDYYLLPDFIFHETTQ